MAEAVEAARGKAAAEPWLTRAADAPRDPVPGADGTFNLTTEGWQRLVREYGEHGRLAPPPFEAVETAVSEEELLRLMAPPAAEASGDGSDEADAATAPSTETSDADTLASPANAAQDPAEDTEATEKVVVVDADDAPTRVRV